jgi:hypothetical protein
VRSEEAFVVSVFAVEAGGGDQYASLNEGHNTAAIAMKNLLEGPY